jgi:hypothetical protein
LTDIHITNKILTLSIKNKNMAKLLTQTVNNEPARVAIPLTQYEISRLGLNRLRTDGTPAIRLPIVSRVDLCVARTPGIPQKSRPSIL